MKASFVISLDFELMWGVRDKRSLASYKENLLGARQAIPKMLGLFEKYHVGCTWATVGFLFARDKVELLDHMPEQKPNYEDENLSPYPFILDKLGLDESREPCFYATSIIDMIANSPNQELATHTFSHYYALEKGQNKESFQQDLSAALSIAKARGFTLSSIVFPRNQVARHYMDVIKKLGINAFRGNPNSFMYRERDEKSQSKFVRAARLLDSVLPIDGYHGYHLTKTNHNIKNIPASRFLRPVGSRSNILTKFQANRIKSEMSHAAKNGLMYHLWWHPHNFGKNIEANISQLADILEHFKKLHQKYGMESKTMRDLANASLGVV